MKVYCCQLNIEWENKPANFRMVERLLDVTRPEPGSLVVLPEMFATGFSMNVPVIAEEDQGITAQFLASTSRQYQIYLLGGRPARFGEGKGVNEALVYNPEGERIAKYEKIHPFSLGRELEHYARGKEIVTFDWHGVRVAPFICYDLRFPEIFRAAVRQGAEMFVVIANWPAKRDRHWVTLLQARAIENLAFVAGVNRSGSDPSHTYSGRTMIFDSHGQTLADAGGVEGVISAEINPEVVRQWRRDFPALADMHWPG